jgi:hypothetical protein
MRPQPVLKDINYRSVITIIITFISFLMIIIEFQATYAASAAYTAAAARSYAAAAAAAQANPAVAGYAVAGYVLLY